MGLTTEQVLNMSLWQYNAYCEAYRVRQNDELALQIQAAYMCAYWSGFTKGPKKTLDSVLHDIRVKHHTAPKPIDYTSVDKEFQQAEDLKTHGWTKQ